MTDKVKTLTCLQQVSEILEKSDLPPAAMIERVVAVLPDAWSYPSTAAARIVFQGVGCWTEGFRQTPISQSAPLMLDGEPAGLIEVCYLGGKSEYPNPPFREAEHALLDQIAGRLGRAIERHHNHEKIKTLNQQLNLILMATRTRLLLIDEECVVRYADPETQRLYGTPTDQKCFRYLFLNSVRCPQCPNHCADKNARTVVGHFSLPLEEDRIFQHTRVPIHSHAGERLFAAVFIDVTEHKALETKLNHARKLEAVGQLAAGIAHEINTPAQFVGDNVRFLREGFAAFERVLDMFDRLLDAAQNKMVTDTQIDEVRATLAGVDAAFLRAEIPLSIDQTLEGIEHIAKIVRAMKDFSHPGNAAMQTVDLNRAVENTLTVSRGEWKHVANLIVELEPEIPPVPCFPAELNQAVLNIIVNAAQAIAETPSGKGTITVRTQRVDDWVEIQIADTGIGIPEAVQCRIFDHFFTTKDVGKGTGQGLTIARAVIVEKHGGTLNFHSEPGQGTTFIARLPLEPVSAGNSPKRISKVSP